MNKWLIIGVIALLIWYFFAPAIKDVILPEDNDYSKKGDELDPFKEDFQEKTSKYCEVQGYLTQNCYKYFIKEGSQYLEKVKTIRSKYYCDDQLNLEIKSIEASLSKFQSAMQDENINLAKAQRVIILRNMNEIDNLLKTINCNEETNPTITPPEDDGMGELILDDLLHNGMPEMAEHVWGTVKCIFLRVTTIGLYSCN